MTLCRPLELHSSELIGGTRHQQLALSVREWTPLG
jgi:hypothetical protein